jgi:hypothetical protein
LTWDAGSNEYIIITFTFTTLENALELANGMTIEVGFLILNLFALVVVVHDILYDYYYIKYYTHS